MSAARQTSVRALRHLTQRRSLHMTGPAEFPTPLLTTEQPRASRVKRDIEAAQKRAAAAEVASSASTMTTRHFNTSRSLKAVGDTSTIDFAYFPDFPPETPNVSSVRIPLLPSGLYNTSTTYAAEAEEPVMRPEIITTSADSTHISAPSAMSEIHDNGNVDVQHIGEQSATSVGVDSIPAGGQDGGMAKQLWNGLLDDVFGSRKAS